MSLARKRLSNELLASVSIISPDIDADLLEVRIEEILSNYELTRRSEMELEADMEEKILLFLSAMKIEGLSRDTIYGYQLDLAEFSRHCNKAVALITTSDIRLFLASLDKIQTSTLAKKVSTLKSFFGWLVREEILLRDPTGKIKTPKVPKRLKQSLTVEELELVRESCETLRERALIEVLYATGCRLSEVANMKRESINLSDLSISVIGKGNKERVVYLSFKCMYHLRKYLNSRTDDCEYLFVTQRRPIRNMMKATIQQVIDKIEQRSGLTKPLTPHIMRHTFAQLLMDAGIDLGDLQQLMGHSDPGTTQVYAQVSEERKRQAYKKYHAN